MHEVSLVRGVFRTLEEEFSSEEMGRLKTIKMKVGKLSNVEPILMQNAFEAVKADNTHYDHVTLEIDMVPIKVECLTCQKVSIVENYKFLCDCGLPSNNVVSGTELLIHQVEFFG